MSRRPIALSPDLLRLRNEGYDLDVVAGHLLVRDIPYVDAARAVQRGTLVMRLDLSGNLTNKPNDHVAYWIGQHPCHASGAKITSIENPSGPADLGGGLRSDFMFSAKAEYRDYHHKVTTYVGRIAGEAGKVDATADPRTFPPVPADADDGVFKYVDTATSRAGIGAVNGKVAGMRIGIVGLGGTGSYVLDLVAKTLVSDIHLFDADVFSQHNAFRAPGAPSLDDLQARPSKVAYLTGIYEKMRNGIVPHEVFLDEANVSLVTGLDFVFLCLDGGPAKRFIVDALAGSGTPFIEVGMGVLLGDGQLGGIVRVTTSTPDTHDRAAPHVSYAAGHDAGNEYATNIQVAELNSLNASLAVIRWKKLVGIYRDARSEYYAGYSIANGEMVIEGLR